MKRRSVVLLAGVGLSAAIGSFYWLKDKDSLVRQNGYKGSALPDAWDSSADVIVVGGGAAGLSAALSASESGASVILIEQNDALGGRYSYFRWILQCGGSFAASPYGYKGQCPTLQKANY